jgi:hypothetical protein
MTGQSALQLGQQFLAKMGANAGSEKIMTICLPDLHWLRTRGSASLGLQ